MDSKANQLFIANPEVDTLYKVKGRSIYFTSKEGALAHVESDESKLETLKKDGDDLDDVPNQSTKNDDIKAWMDQQDPPVVYDSNDTKKELLAKVNDYLKAQE